MPEHRGPTHTPAWHRCFDKLGADSHAAAICTASTERTADVYIDHKEPTGHETHQHHKSVSPVRPVSPVAPVSPVKR